MPAAGHPDYKNNNPDLGTIKRRPVDYPQYVIGNPCITTVNLKNSLCHKKAIKKGLAFLRVSSETPAPWFFQ